MISGKTQVYGIFGFPVGHSFSPGMHNAAFEKLGLDGCYVPFAVPPDRLADAVRAIIPLGLRGLNVTVPHKERVIPYLDELSEEARLTGTVNTIEIQGGRLIGHTTDGRGFLRSLREEAGFVPRGKRFVLLGSGGAGRAVAFSLALAGARQIAVRDVDEGKARLLAQDIAEKTGCKAIALTSEMLAGYCHESECLINATPLGLKKADPLPLNKSCISKSHLVCDLVYNPPATALLAVAKRNGAKTLRGLGMLLYQGVVAFEIWTGKKAPVEVMKKALSTQVLAKSR